MPKKESNTPSRREFLKTGGCAGICLLLGGAAGLSCLKSSKKRSILPPDGDFSMITYCCLNCLECDAYIATQKNEQQLKAEVAKRWNMQPEQINCNGCKTPSALFNCNAKQCAEKKGVITCAHCDEFPTCSIDTWTRYPDLKKRVEEMREALRV
jgi:hypothetical protein